MQALSMPLHRNRKKKGEEHLTMMTHPGLAQLRHEVAVSTGFLVVVPAITYFSVKYGLGSYLHPHERLYAGLACIASIWLVIVVIVIVKYWDDFKAVYEGRGHVPYDESKIADLEYLRSEQYIKDEQEREAREERQRKAKERYEARKSENGVIKSFTHFDAGLSSDEDVLTKAEEESKRAAPGKGGEKEESKQEEEDEWEYYSEDEDPEEEKVASDEGAEDDDSEEDADRREGVVVQRRGRKKHKKRFRVH